MISLRKMREEDLELVHSWYGSQEALGEFEEPSSISLENFVKKFRGGHYDEKYYLIVNNKKVIGYCNYIIDPLDDWIALIGIIICRPEMRGKGFGTEAHLLLIQEIFSTEYNIFKIEAITDAENLAEQKSLEKSQLIFEGIRKARNVLHGKFRDMATFGITREIWENL